MIEHDEARLLLADILIAGLSDADRLEELRAHVAVCGACRAELAELRRVDALVRAAGLAPTPPAALSLRVTAIAERGVADASDGWVAKPVTEPTGARRLWSSVGVWRAATLVLVAAFVVLAVVAVRSRPTPVRVTSRAALVAAPGFGGAHGTAEIGRVGDRRVVVVRVTGLPVLRQGFYELWVARSATDRVSLGPLVPDTTGAAQVTVALPAIELGYRRVWVTRQPADSGPGWTTDWVLAQTTA